MAQLSDDCFAFGGPMMSVDEAVALIATRVTAVHDIERVSLHEADGRILAGDLAAPLPLPPFTNSAVDGYAVRSRDLPDQAEAAFPVAGRVQAGGIARAPIKPGHAVRIFTGAPMPEGADTVFMQEDVRVEDEKVILPAGLKPGANVRPAGEDIPAGTFALKAGLRLRPQDVALAAAFGLTHLDVIRRIRVAVFSTGDELVSPGDRRAAAQLFDSNRFMLMAMLRRLGCEVSDLGIMRDQRDSLAQGLKQGGRCPRPDPDDRAGFRPARKTTSRRRSKALAPLYYGAWRSSPGVPWRWESSAARRSSACRVIRSRALSLSPMWCGRPCWRWRAPCHNLWLRFPFAPPSPTKRKLPAANMSGSACHKAPDGKPEAMKFPREGAGLLSSLVDTDGLVELGEEVTRVEPGQTVGFLSYASLI